jgi:CheY-like chemotaxis protein
MRQRLPLRYDVVLMDLQMPVMDGYETTQAMQEDPLLREVPVIAMTAHAMAEERARCMALGMASHLTKPLDPSSLYAALAPYCLPQAAKDVSPPTTSLVPRHASVPLPHLPGVDLREALGNFEGDSNLFAATLSAFVTHAQHIIAWLPGAVDAGDWPAVAREAHTLKGLGGTIGATALQGYARGLETAALAHDMVGIERSADLLIQVMASLVKNLQNQTSIDGAAPVVQVVARDVTADDRAMALRLKQLTGECDSEALSLWQQHRAVFASWLPAVLTDRLNAALARCDFDSAFGLLDELDLEADLNER